MFKHFFRSTITLPNSFRWRGLVKPLFGVLGIWLATMGANQAKASPVTPEQTALEKRVKLVRTTLDAQSHGTRQDKHGAGDPGPVAQWLKFDNWRNY